MLLAFPRSSQLKDMNGKTPLQLAKEKETRDRNVEQALSEDPSRWVLSPAARVIWGRNHLNKTGIPASSDKFTSSLNNKMNTRPDMMCVICMDKRACNVLIPCGHACLCDECCQPSKLKALNNICPVGRCKFDCAVKVFGAIVHLQ